MSKRVALYLRVSTTEQTIENQSVSLRRSPSGTGGTLWQSLATPGSAAARAVRSDPDTTGSVGALRREFDEVAGWSVDRLNRSLQELVLFLGELQAKSVDFYLHQQGLDTSTPAGKAMFQMLGVFSEFERAMIVERVKSGLSRARSQGKRLGRRPVSNDVVERIRAQLATGADILKTATTLRVGTGTVHRVKREMIAAAE